MKIQIVIPLWKRPEVTKFCFTHLKKMIEELPQYQFKVLCVISELDYIRVCKSYGFEYYFHDNNPLGAKINEGIKYALESEWDYLMMMNSDNVIKSELIAKYYQAFFEKDELFFGIDRVTYVNFGTDDAVDINYGYSVLGIGKCLKREVVEKAFAKLGQLYRPELNRCLDDTMLDNLIKIRVYPRMIRYEGQLAMDFKSEVNIHPWEKFKDKGTKVCYSLQ